MYRAPGRSTRISFILTLALGDTGRDGDDLQRARLLLTSFARFVPRSIVDALFIVTRPSDMDAVRAGLAELAPRCKAVFLDETRVIPDLAFDPATRDCWPRPNKGWYRQQMLKLAIAQWVRTPFYMTLDSDVLFVRPLRLGQLIEDGRALVNTETARDYARLYKPGLPPRFAETKQARYQDAARVLRHPVQGSGRDFWYGETPVVMSRPLVLDLLRHIEQHWGEPWQQVLLRELPWTEYALYFTHAERSGAFDRYHRAGGPATLMNFDDSLWSYPDEYLDARTLENWDVDRVFDPSGEGSCVVVQSYLGYPVPLLAERVLPRLVTPRKSRQVAAA